MKKSKTLFKNNKKTKNNKQNYTKKQRSKMGGDEHLRENATPEQIYRVFLRMVNVWNNTHDYDAIDDVYENMFDVRNLEEDENYFINNETDNLRQEMLDFLANAETILGRRDFLIPSTSDEFWIWLNERGNGELINIMSEIKLSRDFKSEYGGPNKRQRRDDDDLPPSNPLLINERFSIKAGKRMKKTRKCYKKKGNIKR